MKKTIVALSLLVGLVTVAAAAPPSATADPATQSAGGSGEYHLGLPLRTFAFSATTTGDGTATGQAQVENRASGFRGHVAIDCLNILGNVAVMSGIMTSSTSPNVPVGSDAFFAVQDNGDGPAAPVDNITAVYFGLGIPCTYIADPIILSPFFVPIEDGQIQVSS